MGFGVDTSRGPRDGAISLGKQEKRTRKEEKKRKKERQSAIPFRLDQELGRLTISTVLNGTGLSLSVLFKMVRLGSLVSLG